MQDLEDKLKDSVEKKKDRVNAAKGCVDVLKGLTEALKGQVDVLRQFNKLKSLELFESSVKQCIDYSPDLHIKWLDAYKVVISDQPLPADLKADSVPKDFTHFWGQHHRPLIAKAIDTYHMFEEGDPPQLELEVEYYFSNSLLQKKLKDGSIIDRDLHNYEIKSL